MRREEPASVEHCLMNAVHISNRPITMGAKSARLGELLPVPKNGFTTRALRATVDEALMSEKRRFEGIRTAVVHDAK